ncbi:glycosyltransferase family 2 protein [Streptomonospora sp. PA3]|uniref:glycosyltransferase n=1 Tax=Streptomonospora sp. PA3 TaxID=2607326 RepID=UPI001CA442C2|nr:galactosyltransferase-related protein [Streptomonospora sp. PA3]
MPLRPSDPRVLAAAVADSMVVATDPAARRSGLFYWEMARPWTTAVVDAVRTGDDPLIGSLGTALLDDPGDFDRYTRFTDALVKLAPESPTARELFGLAWEAESNSRIGYHIGSAHTRGQAPVTVAELTGRPVGDPCPADASPPVLIVIPFRDRSAEGWRLRNLLACLQSLRDQSYPRDEYRVVVVESDDAPRRREVIEPYADRYLFARKAGMFNKSWAVNVGVVESGEATEVVCILDADALADRDFVARNAASFQRPGTGGHLTYRDMFCLDEEATSQAIRDRIAAGEAEAPSERLRGFLLRRPPGCCLWVRAQTFHRIGGMDERYEGWGGEDNDFAYRFDFSAPFDSFDDRLLHMSHPPSSLLREDGELVNAHIPPLSWGPDWPIGQRDRFEAEAVSDDLQH